MGKHVCVNQFSISAYPDVTGSSDSVLSALSANIIQFSMGTSASH